jgi:hypothetical protein
MSERHPPQKSGKQAFLATRKVFTELETEISDFEIFNALADLFYERGQGDVSELLSEAAYRCFSRE